MWMCSVISWEGSPSLRWYILLKEFVSVSYCLFVGLTHSLSHPLSQVSHAFGSLQQTLCALCPPSAPTQLCFTTTLPRPTETPPFWMGGPRSMEKQWRTWGCSPWMNWPKWMGRRGRTTWRTQSQALRRGSGSVLICPVDAPGNWACPLPSPLTATLQSESHTHLSQTGFACFPAFLV